MSNRKQIYIFVPPNSDETNPLIRYLLERYPPLPTDSMKIFYETRIAPYSSSNPKKSFCDNLEDMLRDYGDAEDWVTLISMNDDDVFAALLFNLERVDDNGKRDKNIDIYIELFCGNQALPPTGEGTKLLKILEKASLDTKLFNIELSSVSKSVQYYKNNSYHLTGKHFYSLVDMRKHTRAISNWSKIKDSLGPSDRRYLDKLYLSSKASRAKGKKSKKGIKSKKTRGKKTRGKNKSRKIRKL
jgi:hypothetical protein